MATDVTPAEPKAPAEPKLKLDSNIPISQQASKISKFMEATDPAKKDAPAEEPKKEEPTPDNPSKDTPSETPAANDAPNEDPQPEGDPVPEDDDDEPESPAPAPVELGEKGQYILEKMRTYSTFIKDGDNVKEVKWRDTTDLPRDFEFASDAVRTQFQLDLATQTRLANDAAGEYDQKQLQENVRKFEAQEAQDVASDIAYLQKRGILPEFKYAEDDPKFNSDDAVKTANEIYDLYKKTNQDYATKFNGTGRMYRISYREAADKYFARQYRSQANNSQTAKDQPTESKKTPKATQERNNIASKQGAPQGGEPAANRARPRPGMRLSDINRLVREGRI